MASAQFYWGRMAALLKGLAYHLKPAIMWIFVFVDDFMAPLKEARALEILGS